MTVRITATGQMMLMMAAIVSAATVVLHAVMDNPLGIAVSAVVAVAATAALHLTVGGGCRWHGSSTPETTRRAKKGGAT